MESDREGLGANQKKGALTVSGLTPLKSLNGDFMHRGIGESGELPLAPGECFGEEERLLQYAL